MVNSENSAGWGVKSKERGKKSGWGGGLAEEFSDGKIFQWKYFLVILVTLLTFWEFFIIVKADKKVCSLT